MSDAYGMPDISQLTPATGKVGTPPSGAYGEGAALAELQAAFPPPTAPAPGQEQQGPTSAGGVMPAPPPSGALPRSLMPGNIAPTTRPSEPPSTPLTTPMPVAETPREQHIQWLEALARDPSKYETTRAWALAALEQLGRA